MESAPIELPSGGAATSLTLRVMADLAKRAAMTEKLRYKALTLIQNLHASDPSDYVACVDLFCRQSITLIHEPDEILVDPRKMLDDISLGCAAGDCDDISLLAAALLAAIGIRCRFKAVFRAPEGHYQHVFIEYRLRSDEVWRPLDLTIDGIPVYPKDWITEDVL